jgi:hypothetical protein
VAGSTPGAADAESHTARNIGIGCFTTFLGIVSGAMIAVLIGKIVEGVKGCAAPEGLPACNWWVYAGWGAVIGGLSLPTLVLLRLRRSEARAETSKRG